METSVSDGLRVLAALKAARDFGVEADQAADIARRVDPQLYGFDRFVDALARAVEDRANAVPRA
jgi:hypothetical protein